MLVLLTIFIYHVETLFLYFIMDVASVPEDCRDCYLITDVRRLKVIQGEMELNTVWSRDTKTNKTSLLVGLPLYKTFFPFFNLCCGHIFV